MNCLYDIYDNSVEYRGRKPNFNLNVSIFRIGVLSIDTYCTTKALRGKHQLSVPISDIPRSRLLVINPTTIHAKLKVFLQSGQVLALLVLNHLAKQLEWNMCLQVGHFLFGIFLSALTME